MRKKYSNRNYYTYKINLPKVDVQKIFLFIIVGIFLYFFGNSFIKYFVLKKQYQILLSKLDKLKKGNDILKNEIYLINTDTATVEYYIRKELKYKKPSEKVILLRKEGSF